MRAIDVMVGIVGQSNLMQALASAVGGMDQHNESDRQIRLELPTQLQQQTWTDFGSRNVTVADGIVHIWGSCRLTGRAQGVAGAGRKRSGRKAGVR
jgi:hypothetical protein